MNHKNASAPTVVQQHLVGEHPEQQGMKLQENPERHSYLQKTWNRLAALDFGNQCVAIALGKPGQKQQGQGGSQSGRISRTKEPTTALTRIRVRRLAREYAARGLRVYP